MRVLVVHQWEWNSIVLGGRSHCISLLFDEHGGFKDIDAAMGEMAAWCEDNFGSENWTHAPKSFRFEFRDPNHAFAFRIRFCDGRMDITI